LIPCPAVLPPPCCPASLSVLPCLLSPCPCCPCCPAVHIVAHRLGWQLVGQGQGPDSSRSSRSSSNDCQWDLCWLDTSVSQERLLKLGPTQVGVAGPVTHAVVVTARVDVLVAAGHPSATPHAHAPCPHSHTCTCTPGFCVMLATPFVYTRSASTTGTGCWSSPASDLWHEQSQPSPQQQQQRQQQQTSTAATTPPSTAPPRPAVRP
jgi:hypothetical protein